MLLVSVSPILSACWTSGSAQAVTPRTVPGAPGWLAPVQVRDPQLGEDPLLVAARERAGRIQANRIISWAAKEWNQVASEFSQ